MAGDCREEPREFLKRNPLVHFGSYHYWTRRKCKWGRPRISETDLLCCESGSAPSARSRPRLQNTFVTLSSPRRSPPGLPEAEDGRRRASVMGLSISAEVCNAITIIEAQIINIRKTA